MGGASAEVLMIGTVILLQFLATHGSLAPAPAATTVSAAAPAYSLERRDWAC